MARTTLLGLAALLALAAWPLPGEGQSSGEARSVLDGVYTAEQAARGEGAYQKRCATCHATSDFKGELFLFAWSDQGIHILYDFIRASMPEDSPGSLDRDTYSEILAYILELNSFPPGEEELPSKEAALRKIILESGPGAGGH